MLVLATLLVLSFATSASADQVEGLRGEVQEVEHHAKLTLHAGYAEMTVVRTVQNLGERHDQTTFWVDLPEDAVAVGLRTLGTKDGKPHWFEGELLEAEEAAARYQELTGIGGYYPKDPALLSWRGLGQLALQVFPCPPGERKSVEYTLLLPTRYEDGAHVLSLPPFGTGKLPASVEVVPPSTRNESVWVNGARIWSTARIRSGDSAHEIRFVDGGRDPLTLRLARVPTGRGRSLEQFSIEAGPLSTVPKKLDVAFVVDTSVSFGPKRIESALDAVSAYLTHAPHARARLFTFARTARTLDTSFVSGATLRARLDALELTTQNGSDVEAALALAERELDRLPSVRGAERRIVVLTDGLTASRITPERLRGITKSGHALVHVALLDRGWSSLRRDDDHPWAIATEPTGGLVWNLGLPERPTDAGSADPARENALAQRSKWVATAAEELVRPVRLHHFAVRVGEESFEFPSELAEDEGWSERNFPEGQRGALTVTGQLWTRPITRVVGADLDENKRAAALVFGSNDYKKLDEKEMMVLARLGGAVSPVTSYLAIEPGVRPSTEGLDWGVGGLGFGGIGEGGGGLDSGLLRLGASTSAQDFLTAFVAQHWASCGGSGRVSVSVETTLRELVDVLDVAGPADGDPVSTRCLGEALWAISLNANFTSRLATYTVSVGG